MACLVNVHFSDIPHTFIPHFTLHSAEKICIEFSANYPLTTFRIPQSAFRKIPLPVGTVRTPSGRRPEPSGCLPGTVLMPCCDAVLRFAIYSRISFCKREVTLFFSFSMFVVYTTKWRYWASSEHVICVRFIRFWTFNSWITGGVGTAPGGVQTAPDGFIRTVPDGSGRLLVGPLHTIWSQLVNYYQHIINKNLVFWETICKMVRDPIHNSPTEKCSLIDINVWINVTSNNISLWQMAQQWQLFHNFQQCVRFHNGY